MALITCPECGQKVSDKATVCPRCANPMTATSSSGYVRIKLTTTKRSLLGDRQKASVETLNGKTLWEGYVGDIAELHVDAPTYVEVKYHLSAMYYGGSCTGLIDPVKGKKYIVQVRKGLLKTLLSLQMVDVIESD